MASRIISPLLLPFLLFFCVNARAQNGDTLAGNHDSTKYSATTAKPAADTSQPDSVAAVKHKIHSPKKALLFSAILPGLGQAYNRKYWKMPIIYAGLGVMGYFVVTNNQQYAAFQNALIIRTNGGIDQYQQYTTAQLTTLRDQSHYNRDLSVIGALVVYVLNLVDAEVDAQFFNFNMSDDISARFMPSFNSVCTLNGIATLPALTLVMKLK